MFDAKKINFWRLAFIFIGLTVVVLFILWNSPSLPKSDMMSETMGSMMKKDHVSNITIYDLFTANASEDQMNDSMGDMSSHHQNQSQFIYKLSFVSTAIIFLLLPLIIGGSIALAIIWIK